MSGRHEGTYIGSETKSIKRESKSSMNINNMQVKIHKKLIFAVDLKGTICQIFKNLTEFVFNFRFLQFYCPPSLTRTLFNIISTSTMSIHLPRFSSPVPPNMMSCVNIERWYRPIVDAKSFQRANYFWHACRLGFRQL